MSILRFRWANLLVTPGQGVDVLRPDFSVLLVRLPCPSVHCLYVSGSVHWKPHSCHLAFLEEGTRRHISSLVAEMLPSASCSRRQEHAWLCGSVWYVLLTDPSLTKPPRLLLICLTLIRPLNVLHASIIWVYHASKRSNSESPSSGHFV